MIIVDISLPVTLAALGLGVAIFVVPLFSFVPPLPGVGFDRKQMAVISMVQVLNPCELESPGSCRGRNAEFAGGRVLEGSHRLLRVGAPLIAVTGLRMWYQVLTGR